MNPGSLDPHRDTIAVIAEIIFPGDGQQPAASAIALEHEPIERVFRSRPELLQAFISVIDSLDPGAESFLNALSDHDYRLLMTVICAAYVMDERVKKVLGYSGQQALTPNRGGFGCEDLVAEMMQQPKIYRDI